MRNLKIIIAVPLFLSFLSHETFGLNSKTEDAPPPEKEKALENKTESLGDVKREEVKPVPYLSPELPKNYEEDSKKSLKIAPPPPDNPKQGDMPGKVKKKKKKHKKPDKD